MSETGDLIIKPQECEVGNTVTITVVGPIAMKARRVTITKIDLRALGGTGKDKIVRSGE